METKVIKYSHKQRIRKTALEGIISGHRTISSAARMMSLSETQTRRLLKIAKDDGIEAALLDRRRGNNHSTEIPKATKEKVDDYFAGAFYYDNSVLMDNSNLMSPNALGAIINVSKATNVKDALLDTYVEMALVSHGMYHKELDSGNKHNFPGNVTDLIVGYDDYMQYLGYGLGSNLFAFGAGASYDAEKVRAELNAIYTVRGNTRKDSSLTIGKEYYWKIFPVIDKTLPGDALEHRIIISSSIDADIYDFMTIKATAGFIHASNFRNVKSEQFNDFQVSLGVSLHLLPIAEDCISLIKK